MLCWLMIWLSSFKAIEGYTKEMSYDEFINNQMCIDAVIRNFEIVGEAANNISNSFKDKNQQLEWRKMVDFRNRLIHDYFGISYKIVWSIIKNEMPDYIKKIENFT